MTNPTGYTALDLVGFTDKGTYASNVYYVKNDIVHYAGALYRCKVDDTANVTPGENANWTEFIGEPQSLVERIIAPLEDNPATVAYATGRQIIYDDYLWEVIDDIAVGDPLVDYDVDPTNANIKKASPVETQLLAVKAKEGDLTNLTTTAKNNLVAAINEIDGNVGDLASLTTAAKTSAVAAINEVKAQADKCEVLAVSVTSFSSLPQTVSNANIDSDMVVVNSVLGTPSAQTGDWTVTTSDGSLTIAGTISGSTTLTLYLAKSR